MNMQNKLSAQNLWQSSHKKAMNDYKIHDFSFWMQFILGCFEKLNYWQKLEKNSQETTGSTTLFSQFFMSTMFY